MENMNERPVCHRAEDLVTYLYGEASANDARDFAAHTEQCDACRAELALFSQVHESIALWRNEALGPIAGSVGQITSSPQTKIAAEGQFVEHERKLSALAALREFFSVSPLWLRGATGFAAVLLCVLAALAATRLWKQTPQVANNQEPKVFSKTDFKVAVKTEVEKQMSDFRNTQASSSGNAPRPDVARRKNSARAQLAQARSSRLTREEREQLAADLRLIPGREDESPFVFPDEPNQ